MAEYSRDFHVVVKSILTKIANFDNLLIEDSMPTRNVNLTRELNHFVTTHVKSGRYENASEVVRAALRSLERDEQEHEAKIAALREAIDEGAASGVFEGDPFESVRKEVGLPRLRARR